MRKSMPCNNRLPEEVVILTEDVQADTQQAPAGDAVGGLPATGRGLN